MIRLGACLGFLILLGATPGRSLADPQGLPKSGPGSSPENTLFGKLFAKKEPPAPPPTTAVPKLNPREQASKTILQEQQAHLQRLAVCTRLREIADETGNDALNAKADQLEKQAYEVYNKRIAHLPGARDPEGTSAKALDRELGSGVATDPIESDAKKPVSKDAKASAKRGDSK